MKVRFKYVLFALLPLGCTESHRSTFDLGDHVYSQIFRFNPAGVDKVYLTDSLNFMVFVGEFDTEHEKFSYEINGDTIDIFKTTAGRGGVRIMLGTVRLSREYLTKNKVDSTTPLFEFR
ncbi:MAG: hypothetical protein Q8927_11680 [Bacteroidota bacterium]|nr:hypothetical protein [Bacteroidota bacterium]MDP4216853.1 hypothetical protein [Bacteroidota bacterium]MDP4247529.1 hypothetical protein [Bacteroidota bacterium]MDP4260517.1 hypothetical protein [Bacteroidota bacterium]